MLTINFITRCRSDHQHFVVFSKWWTKRTSSISGCECSYHWHDTSNRKRIQWNGHSGRNDCSGTLPNTNGFRWIVLLYCKNAWNIKKKNNSLCLGEIPEEIQEFLAETVLFPERFGEPSEYAELVESIVDNPLLNGVSIRIDGGTRGFDFEWICGLVLHFMIIVCGRSTMYT